MGIRRGRMPRNEAGFTVLESVMALTIIFVILLMLLSALTAGTRGLVTGRQRSAALAVANEVLENARGRAYTDVGHDFDSDPTLATDPELSGTAPNLYYNGEPLAGSNVDAGTSDTTNPLFPFSPHQWNSKRDGTTYATTTWVTTVVPPGTADAYKRITVKVEWTPAQSSTKSVTLSSYLYNSKPSPDPRLIGQGAASAGTFTVCATLQDCSDPFPVQLDMLFPQVSGLVDSGFVKLGNGSAATGSTQLTVDPLVGTATSCSVAGPAGSCQSAKADASADDDSGTVQPETDDAGPVSNGPTYSVTGGELTATVGPGSARAQAAGRSCSGVTCGGPAVGDGDWLPYFLGTANGTGGTSVDYAIRDGVPSTLAGSFLSFGTTCPTPPTPGAAATNSCGATVEIDRDEPGGTPTLTSTASVAYPSIAVTTAPSIPGGVIKLTPGWITATATASGPTATSAAITQSTGFSVSYWNGASYTDVNITPGVAHPDIHVSVSTIELQGSATLDISAVIHVNGATSVDTGPDVNGLKASSATAAGWLVADVHFLVQTSSGTVADYWLHLDLGQVTASASYQRYVTT